MKITTLNVVMTPSDLETDRKVTTLERLEDRTWIVRENNTIRGLLPYEVRIANNLQQAIVEFNGKN